MIEDKAKEILHQLNTVIIDEWFPDDPKQLNPEKMEYIEKANGPAFIVSVVDVIKKMNVTDRDAECFFEKMINHRYSKDGVWMYGCKITYDPLRRSIYAEDLHEAEVRVMAERNKPIAYIRQNNMTSWYRIPAERLDDFLYNHDIDARRLRVVPDSIKTFYSYYGNSGRKYFVTQTDYIKKARKNAPAIDLWRLDVNLDGHSNGWGITFAVWEDHLVEEGNGGIYLSEDMTEKDYKIAIAGYYPNSWVAKEIKRIYNANDDTISEATNRFQNVRARLQSVINKHTKEIYDYMLEKMGLDPAMKHEAGFNNILHIAEQKYGFDCGWIHFLFDGDEMNEIVKTASMSDAVGVYANGSFSLKLPYATQSTTVQGYQADKAIEFIEAECGNKLRYLVQLD